MKCAMDGCGKATKSRGWCSKHYEKWRRHGSVSAGSEKRDNFAGTINPQGYLVLRLNGKTKMGHVAVAERALGHRLPSSAIVHHVDHDRRNNAPDNLVICPSHTYHQLIHRRERALLACGHAHWLICQYCSNYDAPDRMWVSPTRESKAHHRQCARASYRAKHPECKPRKGEK